MKILFVMKKAMKIMENRFFFIGGIMTRFYVIPFEVHKTNYKLDNNLILYVGCDIEENNN